jgi:peroxiredoxin
MLNYEVPAQGRTLSIITDDKEQPETKVAIKMRSTPQPTRRPQEDMLGKPVPTFSLSTTQGKSLATADLKEKDTVTVLNFFAVNCGFCKKAMPRVETVRSEFEGKNVRFVNVSQTMRQPYPEEEVIGKCNELGWKGEIALDPKNSVGPLFSAQSYPSLFVVSRDGTVGEVVIGNKPDLEQSLRDSINAMLKPGYRAPEPGPATAQTTTPAKPTLRPQEQMIGQPAPEFALTTMAGRSLATKDLKGQVTVLDFFAVNCGFCGKQMPRVDTIRSEYAAKGVRFVSVSQTMRNKRYTDQEVLDKCKSSGWSGEIATDPDNKVGPLFNAQSYPSLFVVGKTGKVDAAIIGNKADLETLVKSALDDALKAGTEQAKAGPTVPRGDQPQPSTTGALSPKK